MEEVSNPSGLSGASQGDPAMLAAAEQAAELRGKEVVDVNGIALGRVSRAFGDEGALLRFDVHLTAQARRILGVEREVASLPADAIAGIEQGTVRLREAAEAMLDAERPRDINTGAKELPRKIR